MSDNKHIGYGLAAGVCFFTAVLAHDFKSDDFNMVDHFKANTEDAYRVLFLSSLAVGGIGGGGLGAAVKHIANRHPRPSGKTSQELALDV